MIAKEYLDNAIKYISAENEGKQVQHKYLEDENFHNCEISDLTFSDFKDESKLRIVPFKEYKPDLTEREWQLVLRMLYWIQKHDLSFSANNFNNCERELEDIIEKIDDVHIPPKKGNYNKLLDVLKGMKAGKDYAYYCPGIGTETVTEQSNIYPLNTYCKKGIVKEVSD